MDTQGNQPNEMSEQAKRQGLATELADLFHRQQIIVNYNPKLEAMIPANGREVWRQMAEEDAKNLRLLDEALINFGLRVEPRDFTRGMTDLVEQTLDSQAADPLEKIGAYALVKQQQAMCGHLLHKAIQVSALDVREALVVFQGAYSSFTKQMVQLNQFAEDVGVSLLVGEEAEQGLLGRVRDAAAMASGAILNTFGKPGDEANVLNLLRLDHHKVSTIFDEIRASTDPGKSSDLFEQLRSDLTVHVQAEEQTVYNFFRRFEDIRSRLDNSQHEHEQMRTQMTTLSELDPARSEFASLLASLQSLVDHHVDEEENQLFDLFRAKATDIELQQLAADFMNAKKDIQEQQAATDLSA